MNKVAILVYNNFTHDKRVMNVASFFYKKKYHTTVFAAKTVQELKSKESAGYKINRISLFSALLPTPAVTEGTAQKFSRLKTTHNDGFYHKYIRNNKIKLHVIDLINEFIYFIAVIVKLLVYKPDLIYCNDLDTLLPGFIIARLLKIKLIYDSHELFLYGSKYQSSFRLKRYLWQILEKNLINNVNAVIVTSKFRANILKKQYNLKKIHVVRNCPNYEPVKPNDLFRKEFSLPLDNTILLYQGLLTESRGIFELVDIVSEIDKVNLIFLGMGRDIQRLKDYILAKGVSGKIFVKNAVNPKILLNYTSSADIGLQLLKNININHYSTISNKLFEYIMSGIAIIASDFPEISSIVEANKIGYCVDPDNREKIKSTILKLIIDPEKLNMFKQNSLKCRIKYTWEKEVEIIEKILSEIELS